MSRYQRRQTSMSDTLKDYLVPIVGWLLIILILWSVLWGNNDTEVASNTSETRTPTEITFLSPETEAVVVYPNESKDDLSSWAAIYEWESVIVKEWSLELSPSENTTIKLNKIAELKYQAPNSFAFYSSDWWFESSDKLSIDMRYASIDSWNDTVLSLTQNEAVSTIYVLAGTAKVTNLWGSNTSLIKWQKISISRQDAAKGDADLASEKTDIDSYFKSSDWFIENEWYITLQQEDTTTAVENSSWSVIVWDTSGRYIQYDNLSDEITVSTSSIDVTGTVISESVWAFTIAGKQAEIGSDRSFSVSWIPLASTINDLVVKVYDTNKNILEKKVYSVNTNTVSSTSTSSTTQDSSTVQAVAWATNFDIDATDFGFTAPSVTGKFSTTWSEITIRGITTAEWITWVQVNGFDLASFNGSTWRYHAFTRFGTLQNGSNQYKIDYFKDDTLAYTDYYTIVKQEASTAPVVNTTSPTENTEEETEDSEEEILEEPETAL